MDAIKRHNKQFCCTVFYFNLLQLKGLIQFHQTRAHISVVNYNLTFCTFLYLNGEKELELINKMWNYVHILQIQKGAGIQETISHSTCVDTNILSVNPAVLIFAQLSSDRLPLAADGDRDKDPHPGIMLRESTLEVSIWSLPSDFGEPHARG